MSPPADTGYVGNVDVNCIIDQDGNPWSSGSMMRLGCGFRPSTSSSLLCMTVIPSSLAMGVVAEHVPALALGGAWRGRGRRRLRHTALPILA